MAEITNTKTGITNEVELLCEHKFKPGNLINGIIDFSSNKDGRCIKVILSREEVENFYNVFPWHIYIGHEIYTGILAFLKERTGKDQPGFHWEVEKNGSFIFRTFETGKY